MTVEVVVTGIGLVTAIANTRLGTWSELLAGKTGIALNQKDLPLAIIKQEITGQTPRVEVFLKKAVQEAIADAKLTIPLTDCGLAVGSSRSYQHEIEKLIFAESLHSGLNYGSNWLNLFNLSSAIAQFIQTQNTVVSSMAACATGNLNIFQAYELIQTGHCEIAIAAAADAAITPLTIAGFQKLGVMAKTGLYPFSLEREGLVLGEGAAALVLESKVSAKKRGAKIYGVVLGFGISNDADHVTTPHGQQAAIAVKSCLARSQLSLTDVDMISTHSTGTILNDQMEADLIQKLFPHAPAIVATKGATGHALGATSMIEAAFCLLSLQTQVLPPCTGLRSPAFALNLQRSLSQSDLGKCDQAIALNFSFGFGGQNSVVAFAKSNLDND
jgi:3-oxoacyl-[acyl-carrier-protein] synthase II